MLKNLFQPPVYQDDPDKSREAAITHTIALFLGFISIPSALFVNVLPTGDPVRLPLFVVSLVASAMWFGAVLAVKLGYYRIVNIVIIFFNLIFFNGISLVIGGSARPGIFLNFLILALAFLLLPRRGTIVIATLASIFAIGIYLASINGTILSSEEPTEPFNLLLIFLIVIFISAIILEFAANLIHTSNAHAKSSEAGLFAKIKELESLSENLENQIKSRTQDLELAYKNVERRAKQFEAVSRVSRVINQSQGLQDLLPQITQVISQQFGFYHVGVFLLYTNSEYAVLAASNSEGGQRMLVRNHKLKVGQVGIVGNVAKTGAPRIALDTGADAIYFNNPDLPETRSEMALPLFLSGQQLTGVVDIQSTEQNAFGPEDIQVLSTLADQVSIAIVNARLFEQTQKALLESEMVYRRDIQTGWAKFTRSLKLIGIHKVGLTSNLISEPMEIPGADEVLQSGNPFQKYSENTNGSRQITIPMKLRGEIVGMLNVKTDNDRAWSADELDIISAIVERAALSIENARLLNESQKRAIHEQTISQMSTRIGAGTDIATILKTAVRELGTQISGAQISVEMENEQAAD